MVEASDNDLVSLERSKQPGGGSIMRLALNRPAQLNAFNQPLHDALAHALSVVEADPPQVLIITGHGRGFCAGQDLAERMGQIEAGETIDLGEGVERKYNSLIRRVQALNCITVAAVNGVAAGAGFGLALAADIVIAARSARFVLAYGKIGLAPDAGVSWALPRLVGHARALALILTGEDMSVDDAKSWGIVWDVVADDELNHRVWTLAKRLCAGSPDAQLAAKRLIGQPAGDLGQQLDRERDAQQMLGHTEFYRAALTAFASRPKRDPVA